MNYLKTLLALIFLIALGSYAYQLDKKPVETEESKKGPFVDFAFDKLTNLQIQRNYDTFPIEFSRPAVGSDWMMQKPFTTLADQGNVNEFVNDIKLAKVETLIPAAEVEKAENFGLGTDAVRLTMKAGTTELLINYGKKNPVGDFCYARVAGSKDVCMVESKLLNAVLKPVLEYRDKKITAINPETVTYLEISYPGGNKESFKFKKNQDTWYMESPKAGRCDGMEVKNMLTAVQNASASKFIDVHEAGYNEPSVNENAAEILLKFGTNSTSEVGTVLAFGKNQDAGNLTMLKSNYKKEIILIDKNIKTQLTKKANDFMPKVCVDFNAANTNKINLIPGDTVATELKKIGSEWKIAKQGSFEVETNADSAKVENLLQKLQSCKALKIEENTSNVELISDFSKATLEIKLGLSFADRTESVFIIPGDFSKHPYVKGNEKDNLYQAAKEDLNEIVKLSKEIRENQKPEKNFNPSTR